MKKITTILFALTMFVAANAQIIRGTIGNAIFTDYTGSTSTVYGLDFTLDGINEFAIYQGYDPMTGDPIENGSIVFNYEEGGNNVATDPEAWDYFNTFSIGDVIGPSTSFSSYGDCYFADYTPSSTPLYLGFRIKFGAYIHYGYAQVTMTQAGVEWNEIYFNAIPNAPITIGGTQEAITTVEEASLNIRTLGNRQLGISQANVAPVQVYDMMGRQVGSATASEVVITLPAAGVYVVSTPTIRRAVVVE